MNAWKPPPGPVIKRTEPTRLPWLKRPDVVQQGTSNKLRNSVNHWGPKKVFAESDLYTKQWGDVINTEIEQFFFGQPDQRRPKAVDFFCNLSYQRFRRRRSIISSRT